MSKVEGGGRVDVAARGGTDGVADGIVYNCYGEKAVIVVFLSGLEILLAPVLLAVLMIADEVTRFRHSLTCPANPHHNRSLST